MLKSQLTEQYILYIDLLGDKATIAETDEEAFLEIIDRAFAETMRTIETMSQTAHSNSVFAYKAFSDNIIISTLTNSVHAHNNQIISVDFKPYAVIPRLNAGNKAFQIMPMNMGSPIVHPIDSGR